MTRRVYGGGPGLAGAAVTLLALGVGCAPPADPGPDLERIDRVEQGLVLPVQANGQAPRTASLEDRMRELNVPGVSIAVIDDGRIDWAKAYGVADKETGRPVTTETLFQAASISKPVAAMAALRLVDEGRLDLDTDVNEYLEAWKVPYAEASNGRVVTLRRLVTHTAGLTVHGFPGYARSDQRPDAVGVLDGEGNTPPVRVDTEPGTLWRYSGGGYTVLQQMLVDVTGREFPEILQSTVLEPAGMSLSTYAQPLPESRWEQAANGYRPDGSVVEEGWHVYPEMAAAGLWTTPTDLATLVLGVQRWFEGDEGGVLSPAMTRQMLEPGLGDWGLGFGLETGAEPRFGHGGSNEGFKALLTMFMHRGQGLAVMSNGDLGGQLNQEILLSVAGEYGWPGVGPREVEVVVVDPEHVHAVEGTYRIPEPLITVSIEAVDGTLYIEGDQVARSPLLWVSLTELVSQDDGSSVELRMDPDGAVIGLLISGRFAAERVETPSG